MKNRHYEAPRYAIFSSSELLHSEYLLIVITVHITNRSYKIERMIFNSKTDRKTATSIDTSSSIKLHTENSELIFCLYTLTASRSSHIYDRENSLMKISNNESSLFSTPVNFTTEMVTSVILNRPFRVKPLTALDNY
jgi:hypothetical protein